MEKPRKLFIMTVVIIFLSCNLVSTKTIFLTNNSHDSPILAFVGEKVILKCFFDKSATDISITKQSNTLSTTQSQELNGKIVLTYTIDGVNITDKGIYHCNNFNLSDASGDLNVVNKPDNLNVSCFLMDAQDLMCHFNKSYNEMINQVDEERDVIQEIKYQISFKTSNGSELPYRKEDIYPHRPWTFLYNNWPDHNEVNLVINRTFGIVGSSITTFHSNFQDIKKPNVGECQLIQLEARQAIVQVKTQSVYKYLFNLTCINTTYPFNTKVQQTGLTEKNIILPNLTPDCQYNCTIQLHFIDDKGFASDSFEFTFQTHETIPSAAPTLLPAIFKTDSNVTFYFTPVNKTMLNGQLIRYEYKCDDDGQWQSKSHELANGSITCPVDDSSRNFIHVQLKACTRIGCNSFPARRKYSLKESSALQPPEFRVITNGLNYSLLTAKNGLPFKSFLLICRRTSQSVDKMSNECSSVEVITLQEHQSKMNLPQLFETVNDADRVALAYWNENRNTLWKSWTFAHVIDSKTGKSDMIIDLASTTSQWPTAWTNFAYKIKIPSRGEFVQSLRLQIQCLHDRKPMKTINTFLPKDGSFLPVETSFEIQANDTISEPNGCLATLWYRKYGNSQELLLRPELEIINKIKWIWWILIALIPIFVLCYLTIRFISNRYSLLKLKHHFDKKSESFELDANSFLFEQPNVEVDQKHFQRDCEVVTNQIQPDVEIANPSMPLKSIVGKYSKGRSTTEYVKHSYTSGTSTRSSSTGQLNNNNNDDNYVPVHLQGLVKDNQ